MSPRDSVKFCLTCRNGKFLAEKYQRSSLANRVENMSTLREIKENMVFLVYHITMFQETVWITRLTLEEAKNKLRDYNEEIFQFYKPNGGLPDGEHSNF